MPRNFANSSSQYLASIDAEIGRLQTLRGQVAAVVQADSLIAKSAKPARSGISAEGRRRIADAQKARWAKQKKATKAAAKVPKKRSSARTGAAKANQQA